VVRNWVPRKCATHEPPSVDDLRFGERNGSASIGSHDLRDYTGTQPPVGDDAGRRGVLIASPVDAVLVHVACSLGLGDRPADDLRGEQRGVEGRSSPRRRQHPADPAPSMPDLIAPFAASRPPAPPVSPRTRADSRSRHSATGTRAPGYGRRVRPELRRRQAVLRAFWDAALAIDPDGPDERGPVEPTGIEPVTSCVQGASWSHAEYCPVRVMRVCVASDPSRVTPSTVGSVATGVAPRRWESSVARAENPLGRRLRMLRRRRRSLPSQPSRDRTRACSPCVRPLGVRPCERDGRLQIEVFLAARAPPRTPPPRTPRTSSITEARRQRWRLRRKLAPGGRHRSTGRRHSGRVWLARRCACGVGLASRERHTRPNSSLRISASGSASRR
jgi:hypothetical protein